MTYKPDTNLPGFTPGFTSIWNKPVADLVNSPKHYTTKQGWEMLDVIKESTQDAPNGFIGSLQGNVLKYLGTRLWRKENALQDAKKAQYYLNKLVEEMSNNDMKMENTKND